VKRDSRFIKFVLVGILNAAFGSGVYALLIFAGSPIWCALLVGNAAGVIFNFFTTGRMVFSGAPLAKLPRFVVAYLACYIINYAAIRVLVSLGFSPIKSQLCMVVPVALLSFYTMSRYVFNTRTGMRSLKSKLP
jgi:putative flippase GtrA